MVEKREVKLHLYHLVFECHSCYLIAEDVEHHQGRAWHQGSAQLTLIPLLSCVILNTQDHDAHRPSISTHSVAIINLKL